MRSAITTRAVVLAVLLVATAAACNGESKKKSTVSTKPPAVPGKLADGTTPAPMPDGVRRFRGRPVIQAKELPGQAAKLLCPEPEGYGDRSNPIGGWISTDGLSVGYAVVDDRALLSCDAVHSDGRWQRCAEKVLKLDSLSAELLTKEERATVCDDQEPPRGFAWVAVPSGTAWALVDHRSYWVAYLAVSQPAVRVSTTEGLDSDSARGTIAFVDQRGRVVLERQFDDGAVVAARPSG